jgi:ABC-type multidrug transport system ATPase subunit/pSer/pThr/pTyr-binding forkhead associated (FHA) protein
MDSNYARLQILEAGQIIQEFPLIKRNISIGRQDDNDLVIERPQISRYHARLHFDGRSWQIENLSEANPVQLLGGPAPRPIAPATSQPLAHGDQFILGGLVVRLLLAGQPQPVTPGQINTINTQLAQVGQLEKQFRYQEAFDRLEELQRQFPQEPTIMERYQRYRNQGYVYIGKASSNFQRPSTAGNLPQVSEPSVPATPPVAPPAPTMPPVQAQPRPVTPSANQPQPTPNTAQPGPVTQISAQIQPAPNMAQPAPVNSAQTSAAPVTPTQSPARPAPSTPAPQMPPAHPQTSAPTANPSQAAPVAPQMPGVASQPPTVAPQNPAIPPQASAAPVAPQNPPGGVQPAPGPYLEDRPTIMNFKASPSQPRPTVMLTDLNKDGQEDHGFGTLVSSGEIVLRVSYGSTSREYPLTAPHLTIGRDQSADIVILVPFVAPLHAVLTRNLEGGYTITDQNSPNGLFYKGKRVNQVRLVDDDVIRIFDDLGNTVTLTYDDIEHPAPMVRSTLHLDPATQNVTIGRDDRNTMVLNYPPVSAFHAVIKRQPDGSAMLHDLGSANGTFVQGRRVHPSAPVPLQPGDVIQIVSYELVYQPDQIAQADASQVRLDAIRVGKKVNNNQLTLLDNVSVSIQPKEFIALVGGSGTGKSTLMDALNGFRPAPEGKVLLNGDDYYRNFAAYRSNLGYVPQEDIIHRDLTVEKALYYVAKLRLPQDTSRKEIEARIAQVLDDVEMTHRRKVPVSRLSGGQRKRVSIAVELLAQPNLFFLDEPTSGLDPGLDKRMMSLLRRLADQGRTVILITHATTNITICDKVAFMAPGGKLAFFGPPKEALAFFGVNEFADIYTKLEHEGPEWQNRYLQSDLYKKYVEGRLNQLPEARLELASSAAADASAPPATPLNPTGRATRPPQVSGFRQFLILTRRYADLVARDRVNILVLLLQAPIIGAILAMVAGQNIFASGKSPANAQQVLFVLSIAAVWLGTSNSAKEITKEIPVYLRERLVNLRIVPYVMSKVAVLSLLCLVQSLILAGIVMLVAGVPPTGSILPPALELIIGVWLTTMGGLGMGLLISAIASNVDKATSIVPIILVPQIILAGVVFSLNGPTKVLSYVTISKWSIDSLGTTSDLNRMFYTLAGDVPKGTTANAGTFDPENYDDQPSAHKYPPFTKTIQSEASRRDNLLVRWGILAGMFVLFIVLTCFFQKLKDRAWTSGSARKK